MKEMKPGLIREESRRRRAAAWSLPLALAILIAAAFATSAATLYVSQTTTNPSPPYATWDTAAQTPQPAVAIAGDGDTVLVAPGQYTLTNQVVITNAMGAVTSLVATLTIIDPWIKIQPLSQSKLMLDIGLTFHQTTPRRFHGHRAIMVAAKIW